MWNTTIVLYTLIVAVLVPIQVQHTHTRTHGEHARPAWLQQAVAGGTRPSGWLCPLQIAVRWYPWEQEIVYAIFDALLLADL